MANRTNHKHAKWTPAGLALLGTAPDAEVARIAGVSQQTARRKRVQLGLPSRYENRRLGRKGPGGRRKGAGRPPLGDDARSEKVQIRLTVAEDAAAREIAEREGSTLSDFGRAAILLALARGSTR